MSSPGWVGCLQSITRLFIHWSATAGNTLVFYPNHRKAPAFIVSDSDNVRIQNVTIHHAGGMGVVGQCALDLCSRKKRRAGPSRSTVDHDHAHTANDGSGNVGVDTHDFAARTLVRSSVCFPPSAHPELQWTQASATTT